MLTTAGSALNLSLERLDTIEAPLSDLEWGVIAGAAFGIGVIVGAVIVIT